MKEPLIVLTGPTAVGKTKASITLAKRIGGEIISADSMQVYRHMDIGSAKIRPEEMGGVPHYLVDVLEPDQEFNVVRFQSMAREAVEKIRANGHIPIVVGGTGFYIQALLYDIDFTEGGEDNVLRGELEAFAREKGPAALHARLAEVDEESAKAIHPNNVKRVIRALEFYHQTGGKISEHNERERQRSSPYDFRYFVLNDERSRLYGRIDRRVDQMMEEGLLEEAVYRIKRDTRHFAKRQITWFKREKEVIWIDKPSYDYDEKKIVEAMLSYITEGVEGICLKDYSEAPDF